VEEFHLLSKEIINLPSKAHFTMVHLDCEELEQGLSNKAKAFAEILLKRLVTRHREQNLLYVTPCSSLGCFSVFDFHILKISFLLYIKDLL